MKTIIGLFETREEVQEAVERLKDEGFEAKDISLMMKGVDRKEAGPSNWTVAWVDQNSRYRLLSLNQRDPASVPQGGTKIAPYGHYQEWKNNFRTCAHKAQLKDVKAIVLTPKELSYKETEGLRLEWK